MKKTWYSEKSVRTQINWNFYLIHTILVQIKTYTINYQTVADNNKKLYTRKYKNLQLVNF